MKRIILVRHAQSEKNKLGIHQGQLHDSVLSDEGKKQAELLSDKLKVENFKAVYASDMKRTLETADFIIKSFSGLKVISDKRLREFNMGDFDKDPKNRDEFFKKFYESEIKKGKTKYEIRPPNGENIWDFINRIKSFIDECCKEEGSILIISHGGSNEVFLNVIQGLDKYNFRRYQQDNACINELIFDESKWKIISMNDSSHLSNIINIEKTVYPNQENVREQILKEIKGILKEIDVKEAFLFGDLSQGSFGRYSKKIGRHEGSVINVIFFREDICIPREWKCVAIISGLWQIYEIGKHAIGEIKHRIDLYVPQKINYPKIREIFNKKKVVLESIK